MKPVDRSGFEIAIICALSREATAIDALLDQIWEGYRKQPGDMNIYTTGKIGEHNIVVTHMSGEGKARGASVATSLRMSFTGIKIALVVGICGAVPFTSGKEIVLGDVVISNGAIQYDHGAKYPDRFERKHKINDNLPRLGPELMGLLNKLQIPRNLRNLAQRTSELLVRVQQENGYDYPGRQYDTLFEGSYRHKHYCSVRKECGVCAACESEDQLVCEKALCNVCAQCKSKDQPVCKEAEASSCEDIGCHTCNPKDKVSRERLETDDPKPAVHIGTIASGDTVMKSGHDRDEKARTLGVIAFEMEGAGVWENLPCLVIKSACDYADSHKNDKFQCYAAATAAACAKAFLEVWSQETAQSDGGR